MESLFSSPENFIRETHIFRLLGPLGNCDLSTLTRLGTPTSPMSLVYPFLLPFHTQKHTLNAHARVYIYVSASFVFSSDKWRHLEIRRTGTTVVERYFPCLRRGKWHEWVSSGIRRRLFPPEHKTERVSTQIASKWILRTLLNLKFMYKNMIY